MRKMLILMVIAASLCIATSAKTASSDASLEIQGSTEGTTQNPPVFSILDYGAVEGGNTLNTKAIQKAIDACVNAGKGQVVVPKGIFLTGTVYMRDNITLCIQKGATLLGSNQIEHYPEQEKTGTRMDWYLSRSLIFARNTKNITIKGEGLLNGNSKDENNFMSEKRMRKYRPMILWFDDCDNVLVEGVTFTGSGYWTQAYTRCRNGRINGVTVTDSFFENNDGCDIVDCENFIVENCNIDRVVDDGICLKAYTGTGCKNIIIRRNKVRTLCNALKTGTDSSGDGFQNILIEDNELTQIGRAGIALEITDGGIMKNVIIRNIKMDVVGCPIFIKLGDRQRPVYDAEGREIFPDKLGIIQDVHISGIQAIVDDVTIPPKKKYYPDMKSGCIRIIP